MFQEQTSDMILLMMVLENALNGKLFLVYVIKFLEARTGIEPMYTVLQTAA